MFGRRQEGEDTSELFASARATYEQGEAQRIGVQFQEGDFAKDLLVSELCEETASLYRKPSRR